MLHNPANQLAGINRRRRAARYSSLMSTYSQSLARLSCEWPTRPTFDAVLHLRTSTQSGNLIRPQAFLAAQLVTSTSSRRCIRVVCVLPVKRSFENYAASPALSLDRQRDRRAVELELVHLQLLRPRSLRRRVRSRGKAYGSLYLLLKQFRNTA
jgi:hypothetical protein